jgi:hypothetical protein
MPYYIDHENNPDFGNIKISPCERYRKLFTIGHFCLIPYIVMSDIKLNIIVERLPNNYKILPQNLYIRYGDGSYNVITTIDKTKISISAKAEYTGDTKLFIASSSYSTHNIERFIDKVGIQVFHDNVISINNYIFGGVSVIGLLATLLCLLLGWLLGFIKIGPF